MLRVGNKGREVVPHGLLKQSRFDRAHCLLASPIVPCISLPLTPGGLRRSVRKEPEVVARRREARVKLCSAATSPRRMSDISRGFDQDTWN